jgi:hypothetical protein
MNMANSEPFEEAIEQRLANLIGGHLAPGEAQEVLSLIARDDQVRRRLDEMLSFQAAVRQAYGYDRAESPIRKSLPTLLAALRSQEIPAAVAAAVPRRLAAHRPARRVLRVLAYAAALAMAAVSIFMAVSARNETRATREQLARLFETTAVPKVSDAERQQFRRLWTEVADGADGPQPWVVLSDGGGQFGYLPAAAGRAPDERLVLIRCFVVSAQAERVETVSLLLPARRGQRLAIPDVGRLLGRSLACEVTMDNDQAAVSLTVGQGTGPAAAVRGNVGFGQRGGEIGQFSVGGEPLRVFAQAIPLGATAG